MLIMLDMVTKRSDIIGEEFCFSFFSFLHVNVDISLVNHLEDSL